jgi:hypothetical protein
LSIAEYIAIAGVCATFFASLITWLIMKRQFASKRLSYTYIVQPIIKSDAPDLARDLKVFYRGEELPQPALLSIEITNTGHTAIEDAEVIIQLPGATYLIPGYFVEIPAGYQMLWSIERTDAEECIIKFKHINPKQIARARFLMDEIPKGEPQIVCPMPNVECTKANTITLGIVPEIIVQMVAPQILGGIRLR